MSKTKLAGNKGSFVSIFFQIKQVLMLGGEKIKPEAAFGVKMTVLSVFFYCISAKAEKSC